MYLLSWRLVIPELQYASHLTQNCTYVVVVGCQSLRVKKNSFFVNPLFCCILNVGEERNQLGTQYHAFESQRYDTFLKLLKYIFHNGIGKSFHWLVYFSCIVKAVLTELEKSHHIAYCQSHFLLT